MAILGPGRIDGAGLTRRGPGARWARKAGDRPAQHGRGSRRARGSRSGGAEGHGRTGQQGHRPQALPQRPAARLLRPERRPLRRARHGRRQPHDRRRSSSTPTATASTSTPAATCASRTPPSTRRTTTPSCSRARTPSARRAPPRTSRSPTARSAATTSARFSSGTFGRTLERAPDRDGPTGRIKLGTESSGGFRNITVSNCVFDRSRGLALETVDGGDLEDVTVTNLTMRDVTTAPIFLRVGNRGRTPGDPPPGRMRRIVISNVVATGVDPRYPGAHRRPGRPPDRGRASHRHPHSLPGRRHARGRRAIEPPENEAAYPEPSMFGTLPAYGFFVRHARNVTLRDVEVGFEREDVRPAFVLHDVDRRALRPRPGPPRTRRAAAAAARRAGPVGPRHAGPACQPAVARAAAQTRAAAQRVLDAVRARIAPLPGKRATRTRWRPLPSTRHPFRLRSTEQFGRAIQDVIAGDGSAEEQQPCHRSAPTRATRASRLSENCPGAATSASSTRRSRT